MGYRPWSRKELDKTERLNSKSNSSSIRSPTQNKGNVSQSIQMSHHYVVYMKRYKSITSQLKKMFKCVEYYVSNTVVCVGTCNNRTIRPMYGSAGKQSACNAGDLG